MAAQIEIGKTRIGDVVEANARELPEHTALAYYEFGFKKTFPEFRDVCNQVAKGLMALGVGKGDHIAFWSHNLPEWVYTQFGSPKMGAVMVTVNTNFRSFELEYLLNQSDSNTLILTGGVREPDEYIKVIYDVCPELNDCKPGQLNSEKLPYLKNVVYLGEERFPGMFTWNDMLEMGKTISDQELQAREESLDAEDVIMMQYTSGTTGYPKGVMLTHSNLLGNAQSMAETMALTPEDTLCIPVPFFHCFGCVIGTMCCLVSGATMAPVTQFKADRVLEAVDALKCTAVHGVPTMFIAELEEMDNKRYDTSHLRTGVMAGSTCPIEVMRGVIDKMGAKELTIVYGQTESSPGITQTRRDDSMEVRTETVGRALPNVEVKIVDPISRRELPVGETGELASRGYHIMKGYYKMPDKTREAVDKDGWLHTGDLAVMDEQGNCRIVGRLKDMIIRGGENIYPREIEEFLYTHPKVKDAQVVGVESSKYGEEVVAFVQLKAGMSATEEEMKEFCKGQISYHKIPRAFIFVQEYPATASGKIQKYKLREKAAEVLDDL
ncbi:AMP-binding protein [Desulfovermiculus halophilus]|uniref:AMP-binding protein n=1 Tax=Desulfovermiculus halophilus TaxID=339722 RepID=UPI000554D2C9|nr:AMP-binding protein [Desulfovermiculus halophilus]